MTTMTLNPPQRIPTRQSERGSALIAVLCLIFTAGLLSSTVIALSKYNAFTVTAHVELQRSFYINEGVANRVQYLIAADRTLYNEVTLSNFDYSFYNTERFVADNVIHTLDYYGTEVEFCISDARSGYDFSASAYRDTLQQIADSDILDSDLYHELEVLDALLTDYMDSDDNVSLNGMEAPDYEALEMSPLPRNEAIGFREELLYIPGFREKFPTDRFGRLSCVRLIAPEDMVDLTGAPSVFTADPRMLITYCNMEESDAEEAYRILQLYRREKFMLSDEFDSLLFQQLGGLSFQESGFYTVTIGAPEGAKRPSRRLTFSFEGFNAAGPLNNTVNFLEWIFH